MNENLSHRFNQWLRQSITIKLIAVGFIALLLLIPLQFAVSLISERGDRQQEVVEKINNSWGEGISLQGPVLKVPYRASISSTHLESDSGRETRELKWVNRFLYFFPDSLDISVRADTEKLAYGIYESVIFESRMELSGHFGPFEYDTVAIPNADIDWERATVLLYCSSLKGIQESAGIEVAGQLKDFKPVYGGDLAISQMETRSIPEAAGQKDTPIPFHMVLKIKGSEFMEFVPVGKITRAYMESDWHSPGFSGEFLPLDDGKVIGKDGFQAHWQVLEINRKFGQTFDNRLPNFAAETGSSFRTDFVIPIDDYQKVSRTSKYGFMLISLTLFVFLVIQLVSTRYIHPLQYFLIGLALVTFYTLLLSVTEHSNFLVGYLVSAGAVVLLISIYAVSVLKSKRTSLVVFFCLALLYSFVYIIIQLEDYALLVGSAGIFLILATIMYVTRNLDWTARAGSNP